jgi:hypothetical protein
MTAGLGAPATNGPVAPRARPAPAVCDDLREAERLRAAGTDVVLIVAPGVAVPALAPAGTVGGRLALLVGEPSEPAVRAAAAAMAAELFAPPAPRPTP